MTCSKCQPESSSRRWSWWVGLALLLVLVAWLDASGALRTRVAVPTPSSQTGSAQK
jgi:MYXO-CTERM domain-containing protein